jgi:predicted ATPase/class 3 adenylate cyclase
MRDLPTGTVTFLYTDIEGSTRRWEEQPAAMKAAVARHDDLLGDAIAAEGGQVFRRMGDGFCAVFTTAPAAVAAALRAQRALHAGPWDAPGPVPARMALLSGVGEVRDGDYIGAHLNRIARLLAAGHGGQTLLAQSTFDLVRDTLPAGASVRDLGEHRLRDLQRPERIYQLVTVDLPADFPPLRTLETFPNNLPIQLTSFIGREREVAEITRLLSTTRLLTLTGSGGTGKTRLALQVAADALESFADGAWLAELAPLADPDLVPHTVAAAVGAREESSRPLLATLIEHLRARRLLLLLDNCEHVIDACARMADALLRACPQVVILASSREPLGIAGEAPYRVPSLSLPSAEQPPTVATLARYEAMRLFVERAQNVQPTFALTEQNASAVADICRRLDGIPLALELAAARVRVLAVEQVAQRLDNRFRLLTGGSRTALPRQQTLRALIDWSYELLTEAERVLLRRLAVFVGGWTLEAAEEVCSGDGVDKDEVLDLLTRLVDKSLVLVEDQHGAARYRLLETVRQYARDRLLEAGEAEVVRGRHLDWFLRLAEDAWSEGWQGTGPGKAPESLPDIDNLRAALEWSRTTTSDETELRLAAGMLFIWIFGSCMSEGRRALKQALARSDPSQRTRARARALHGAAQMAGMQTDLAEGRAWIDECITIYRELGDKPGLAHALMGLARWQGLFNDPEMRSTLAEGTALMREVGDKWGLGMATFLSGDAALERGEYAEARSSFMEGLDHWRATGDTQMATNPLISLARVACAEGDYATATAYAEEGLALRREQGLKWALAIALNSLGEVERCKGDDQRATLLFEESLAQYRDIDDSAGVAWSLHNLGHVALNTGDTRRAATLFAESVGIRRQTSYQLGIAAGVAGLAGVAAQIGQPERAARWLGAATALLASIHAVLAPADQLARERDMAAVRAQLDAAAFTAAWTAGQGLTLEQAMDEACALAR